MRLYKRDISLLNEKKKARYRINFLLESHEKYKD